MPDTPTPGQVAYTGYVQTRHGMSEADAALTYARSVPDERAAWDAAAEAVLRADSAARHTTRACFRYGIGAVLRLDGLGPWTVRCRRWVEREVMPPYAEYLVELEPEGARAWEVEADLLPWEDRP